VPVFRSSALGLALRRGPIALLAAGLATVMAAVLDCGDALTWYDEAEE
jgi:hypothetical protein